MTEELQRAETQRRNLTADVAHELRTPLHIIQGNLEGLIDGVYQPDPAFLEELLEESRRLSRLVEDLQTLAMAESGQLPMSFETIEAGELLADVRTSFLGQAESAGVALEIGPPEGESLTFEGDIGRLTQVLSNLVANALRHTPSGGAITLAAERSETGVRLVVQDNGEGIPEADLPYIFERFWRGDRARSHSGGAGGGLGLAIARQLVRVHGGAIAVESRPGEGARFTIDLPASADAPRN
jgi:signal transduction histidine kinase